MSGKPHNENLIQFRASGPLLAYLQARVGQEPDQAHLSGAARDMLERYLSIIMYEMHQLRLTVGEALVIVSAIESYPIKGDARGGLLWGIVASACEVYGLDTIHAVDRIALVKRLRELSYAQGLAVLDACERWSVGTWSTPEVGLLAVGLVTTD